MFTLTPTLVHAAEEKVRKMSIDKETLGHIFIPGTKIKLTILEKGSIHEEEYSDTIIHEISIDEKTFFLSR